MQKNESNIGKLKKGKATDKTKPVTNSSNKSVLLHFPAGILYKGEKFTTIPKGKYKSRSITTEFLDDLIIEEGRIINEFKAEAKFRISQEEMYRFCELDLLYVSKNNSFRRYKTEDELDADKAITDLLLDWGQNQDATDEIKALFNITDDTKIFDYAKPELLIANIIESCTKEGDLVLDYHLGSGTTAAVAHKMGRRYIGVEQMDYIEDIAVARLRKVIEGEQGGISKSVEWQGGGDFVYLELAEANQFYIDRIMATTDRKELLEIWKEMRDRAFLSYKISPRQLEEVNSLDGLSTEGMQKFLTEVLDKNLLYIPLSEVDSKEYALTEADRSITRSFYSK
ncbi:hypothetical protein HMPREF3027_07490 [Porphyromonas sp. HMSC077F02]|nr:hypothetical protein HMPREF3027_07490 [Porphyromonas sp. HMSC077F02]